MLVSIVDFSAETRKSVPKDLFVSNSKHIWRLLNSSAIYSQANLYTDLPSRYIHVSAVTINPSSAEETPACKLKYDSHQLTVRSDILPGPITQS